MSFVGKQLGQICIPCAGMGFGHDGTNICTVCGGDGLNPRAKGMCVHDQEKIDRARDDSGYF
jgi:hypothetical protein